MDQHSPILTYAIPSKPELGSYWNIAANVCLGLMLGAFILGDAYGFSSFYSLYHSGPVLALAGVGALFGIAAEVFAIGAIVEASRGVRDRGTLILNRIARAILIPAVVAIEYFIVIVICLVDR